MLPELWVILAGLHFLVLYDILTAFQKMTARLSTFLHGQAGITAGGRVRDCTSDLDHVIDMEPTGENGRILVMRRGF